MRCVRGRDSWSREPALGAALLGRGDAAEEGAGCKARWWAHVVSTLHQAGAELGSLPTLSLSLLLLEMGDAPSILQVRKLGGC